MHITFACRNLRTGCQLVKCCDARYISNTVSFCGESAALAGDDMMFGPRAAPRCGVIACGAEKGRVEFLVF